MADKGTTPTLEQVQSLESAEQLVGLESYIQVKYQAVDIVGYRMVHDPLQYADSLPQAEKKPMRPAVQQTLEDLQQMHEAMTNQQKKSEVSRYALSHFLTPLQCALALQSRYEKLKTIAPDEAEKYREQFGTFVVQVTYKETDGLTEIQPNIKGHFDFLPTKGFDMEKHIVEEFGRRHYESIINNND